MANDRVSRMRSGRFARWCALLLAWSIAFATVCSLAWADDPAPADAKGPFTDTEKEARQLYSQGQIHYSLGEYDEAVAAFRRAYELTAAPGLLFNIAQAHRLNSDCKQALEAYRHFARLVPTSEHRGEAEKQSAALTVRCGVVPPPAPRSEVADPAQAV